MPLFLVRVTGLELCQNAAGIKGNSKVLRAAFEFVFASKNKRVQVLLSIINTKNKGIPKWDALIFGTGDRT